jgi:hypothetical protein
MTAFVRAESFEDAKKMISNNDTIFNENQDLEQEIISIGEADPCKIPGGSFKD